MTYRFYLEEKPNWRGAEVKPLYPGGPWHLCDFLSSEVSTGLERLVDEESWDNSSTAFWKILLVVKRQGWATLTCSTARMVTSSSPAYLLAPKKTRSGSNHGSC